MDNVIEFKAKAKAKISKPLPSKVNGQWVPYDGRTQRVWRCECGSTLMQVVEDLGTQCVVCEKVVMPL